MTDSTKKSIRTRFAPSPTGMLHIGGLRTALYNYLYAKQHKGSFILRIEDTDQKRFVEEAISSKLGIIGILNTSGLIPDEGVIFNPNTGEPDEIGQYGPYTQSKRTEIYRTYAEKLLENNTAYYCFCTPERLEQMRTEQIAKKLAPKYDKLCANLTREEIEKNFAEKKEKVVRLRVPESGSTEWIDLVRGQIKFENLNIDDQVLLKSDGFPTYHLANVVDDHEMDITHVIRGEEWLPSTPKHIILYKAFNWEIPKFAHLPLILNEQRKKLSKREGDMSAGAFLNKGYLLPALINFIAFLGWNPKTTEEIFTLDELMEKFSLDNINKSGAVFDIKKLNWINAQYIKALSDSEFVTLALPFLAKKGFDVAIKNEVDLKKVLTLEKSRVQKLEDVGEETSFYFQDKLSYDRALLIWKQSTPQETIASLQKAQTIFESIPEDQFSASRIEKTCFDMIKSEHINTGSLLWPLRVALTGKQKSPGPFECAEILGKKPSIEDIKMAIALLQQP